MNTDDLAGERELARKLEAVLKKRAMGSIIKYFLETEAEVQLSVRKWKRKISSKDLGKLETFGIYLESSEFIVIYLSLC